MQTSSNTPARKRLLLLGGGHSHLSVLMYFARHPLPGLELTLVSRDIETPYSGALPAYLAGTASERDLFIDLRPLAQMAGARLIQANVSQLDLEKRELHCSGRPPLHFDMLSINIGSQPDGSQIKGAADSAIAVKPISTFLQQWARIQAEAAEHFERASPYTLAITGGGPASVELACALQQSLRDRHGVNIPLQMHLFTSAPCVLHTHTRAAQSLATRALQQRGIQLHTQCRVSGIGADALFFRQQGGDEESLAINACILATGAAPAAWLQSTGLALDASGFIRVNTHLQSLSHPFVFATGDIAAIAGHPRPKSGVYAVRQGMPLAKNLRRYALGKPLRAYAPQRKALALLSMSDGSSIASRGNWARQGAWAERWKTWIDRRFIARFRDLPAPPETTPADDPETTLKEIPTHDMRCAGCAAKLESGLLSQVLGELHPCVHADVESNLSSVEDSAIIRLGRERVLLQTVDHFRAFIKDPYLFARIATNHCLSDIHAMGATPHSALAIVGIPHAASAIMADQLRELMTGCTEVLNAHNTALIGGHSAETESLSFGLSVNAFANPDTLLRKTGLQTGDRLILTKALGTGVLFAADMRHQARHRWIANALEQMQRSNQLAAHVFLQHQAHACTDVTGFGLLGHLREMLAAPATAQEVRLYLDTLPILEGALDCLAMGIRSSLHTGNARHGECLSNANEFTAHPHLPLLFDPQTAGGLLAAVPADQVEPCLQALRSKGYIDAVCIGEVVGAQDGCAGVTLCDQPPPASGGSDLEHGV
ncbi:MAG: selenide, water dikinase SelD [Pseudomonadales bacterium]|nr:selenide, water dikinase SelD [Pseudomonadales bacterium]MCP5330584.1 selenide, water dikinase SelD [Pseudomonadales bacterium]MCP5344211.1 selenide, water dikinase SelD [Pseudomonadales bacterium]